MYAISWIFISTWGFFYQDYEEDEEDDDDDEDDTGMGDEGDDSNEGTGSADGNDGYEADDAEVTVQNFGHLVFFTSLLGKLNVLQGYRKAYILRIFQRFYTFGFVFTVVQFDYFLR